MGERFWAKVPKAKRKDCRKAALSGRKNEVYQKSAPGIHREELVLSIDKTQYILRL